MVKVSVVMPAYNQGKYLKKAIDSVLNQTYENFELIINNNGSTDNTKKIILGYNDKRIKYIENLQNVGSYWGVEQCIQIAKGEYIAYIGSDDVWMEDKLFRQVEFLNNNKAYAAVFTETQVINENDEVMASSPFIKTNQFDRYQWLRYLYYNCNVLCWASCMLRKSAKTGSDVSLSRYKQLCDYYQWIQILQSRNIMILPGILTNYRKHGKNESMHDMETMLKRSSVEHYFIIDSYYNLPYRDLMHIFPELKKYQKYINKNNINFFLSLISINAFPDSPSFSIRKMHATMEIFKIYSNHTICKQLENAIGFTLEDFFKITSNGLICKIFVEEDNKIENDDYIITRIPLKRIIRIVYKKILKRIKKLINKI